MRIGNRSLNHFMRGIGRQLAHRNNQNRKSGGYKKTVIPTSPTQTQRLEGKT